MIEKYSHQQKVLAGPLAYPMMVISAEQCVKGFRYRLCFCKKDGSEDKRRNHRFFFEDQLIPL